ncbi:mechanosensitive ion channel [Collinsella tanakaei]|uniref:Mechanosensitive ion channel n=1 Tax=Collinsella ihumii TaxID=1720204 RepID=A0AAW7JSE6_9ACTN|nr:MULTISPECIES: mechanosensitive ion channel domain-containing protein [Collinsella]MBM6786257.1 mechanosensitive ion channel [Collinsella tanakaei]MDN0054824.1 mechanosensitive ion channel [Collinsella ihumii]MDN0062720.1 mechanosensitive ion channel [Collinsella ihumii]MDN0069957.1 mechanosensitive ion channel [Collinsella ihumii]OUO59640.1 mechanosensitive ion channel protein MscS [Collinsella sp. An271]
MEINEYLLAFATNPLVQQIFWTVVLGAATIIVARIAARALRHLLNMDSNPLPSSSIIVNIVRAVIWIVGASIIIDGVYGYSTNAIFTALGVGGIAVSLGFQDTLSNLIGGLQMTFMGIIKPGDNIEIGTEKGVVQDISWRHTTIKDPMGQTVIVPNSVISKTALVHLLPANRVSVPFAVPRYKDDAHEDLSMDAIADRLIAMAREAAGGISPVTDGPKVFFSEITELGIKGTIVLQVEDPGKVSLAADAIVRAIASDMA